MEGKLSCSGCSYFCESDKNGKAAHSNTEPSAVCFITKCASDLFYITENQVKEYKPIRPTEVQSQHRRCTHQLFCLEPIDPRLAVVSWTWPAFAMRVKYHFSDCTASLGLTSDQITSSDYKHVQAEVHTGGCLWDCLTLVPLHTSAAWSQINCAFM